MHKLLQRQLKQARRADAAGEIDVERLCALVDAAYVEVDRERRYTAHAHQVMRDEQAELLKRQMHTAEEIARIGAERAEAERARVVAEAELLKQERLSLLGQLTASVAHELRNPLSTIRNTLQAISEVAREKGLEIDRQVTRVERTIDRCDSIIDDLLEYADARELRPMMLPLDIWLGELLDAHKVPASIALERSFAAPGIAVAIDPERMRRAVVNAVENAAEAIVDTPDLPERRIIVSTHVDAIELGARVVLVIADTGPGMPESVLARAFEPLFSTRGFGTGLGLPTLKRAIEQHGGDVTLDSRIGAGTRVRIRLPIAAAASEAA